MAFEEGKEPKACEACGAVHIASWSRMPVREATTVMCIVCKAILFQGKTVRDYYDLRLADRP